MNLDINLIENKLRKLFEEQLLSLLPGVNAEDQIIHKLASVIKDNSVAAEGASTNAPNVYTIVVPSDVAEQWKTVEVKNALKNVIRVAINESGLTLSSEPFITITGDSSTEGKDISVIASHHLEAMEDTKGMTTETENVQAENESFPDNAFLIVEGVKVFPLKKSVINIGRRLENQLVIDDPRISRNHAQLRAINGRFVLFDLNSTGGSFVNGQRTSQTVLYPGDVISLAGVTLIFGQDNPPTRPDMTETSPFNEVESKDRPTAALDRNTVDLTTDRLTRDKKNKK